MTGWTAQLHRATSCCLALAMAIWLAGCASLFAVPAPDDRAATLDEALLVVAVGDVPEPRPGAGAAPRADYRRSAGYSGGDQATETAADLARDFGLVEIKAWTIAPLRWRCMLYRVAPGSRQQEVLARLQSDPRVRLAQTLNTFETLTDAPAYNDPYLALQTGFTAIDAAAAHRASRGAGVTVAVIDSGVDAAHPDLLGRLAGQRDFVGRPATTERHGTQVAGVIAAVADNRIGIAGVAPAAQVLALRACWATGPGQPDRCNSFTLAEALAAAISAGADVINLSLAGPRDPLLERLTQYALSRGSVVVGALPSDGRRGGFPSGMPGVLAVRSSEDGGADGDTIAAPGRQILTLQPGGSYDFASGSSLAAAHVSGAVALLLAIDPALSPAAIARLLGAASRAGAGPPGRTAGILDACRAVQLMRRTPIGCTARP